MQWMQIGDNGRNLPSTYQQVIANMRYIQDEILPKLQILDDAVFNPDQSNGTDIVIDPDNILKVVGITVITDNMDQPGRPCDYTRNITYELKAVDAIGLSGKEGIGNSHILVMTVNMSGSTGIDYPIWQCAYGDIDMAMFFHTAKDTETWNDWVEVTNLATMLEKNEELLEKLSHRQFITSDNQPAADAQEEGDYWLQPVFPEGLFFQSVTDGTQVTPIRSGDNVNYQFVSTEDADITPSPTLEDFDVEESDPPYPTVTDVDG